MRETVSRFLALVMLFLSGLATVLILGGCGGASQPPMSRPPISSAACATGTVASYLGINCSQGQAVFHWSSYTCTSTPTSICNALGTNGSKIQMNMDPTGPHTILVGNTSLWNVTAGQSVDVVISGSVYGAKSNGNWPHFQGLLGQTGDGTEDNKTTVVCGANCLALNGVSEILCSATSPLTFCTDQPTVGPYFPYIARFNPATSAHPYPLTIEIKLDGGAAGTATLHSVGIHVSEL